MKEFLYQVYLFFHGIYVDICELIKETNVFAALLCFLLCLGLIWLIDGHNFRKRSAPFIVLSSLYATFLFSITVLGREAGLHSSVDGLFKTYIEAFNGNAAMQLDILFNIFLFIPVGIFLFRFKNVWLDFIAVFLLSLIIELLQLLTGRGIFEISDLINNCAGGLIGLAMAFLFTKIRRSIKEKEK